MNARLSPFMQDVMDLWPLWAFLGSGLGAWIVWSLKTWLRINVAEPIAAVREDVSTLSGDVSALKSTAQTLNRRMFRLEVAHDIETGDDE